MDNEASTLLGRQQINKNQNWINSFSQFISPKPVFDDDSVTVSTKKLYYMILFVCSLWLISFELVMAQIMTHEAFSFRNWPLFIPMWLGSFIGMITPYYSSSKLCNNPRIIGSRNYLHIYGIENHDGAVVLSESLPLMRQLLCWNLVFILTYLNLLIAQILYYLWFAGVIKLWDALIPILFVTFIYLMYMFLVNLFSFSTCFLLFGVIIEMVLFTRKISGESKLSWGLTLIPFEITLFYLFFHLIQISYEFYQKIIILDSAQYIVLIGYYLSFFLMLFSCILKSAQSSFCHPLHFNNLLYFCWCIAIPIFIFSLSIIFYKEGKRLAESRGHKEPKLLSKTQNGWESTIYQKSQQKLLFGEILSVRFESYNSNYTKKNSKSISSLLKPTQSNNQTYQSLLSSSIDEVDPSKRRVSEIELSFIINNDINI